MPGFSRPRAGGQEGEPVGEAVGDVLERQHLHAGRGQLEGQGDAVELAADQGHQGGVVGVQLERGKDGAGALEEQPDCGGLADRREIRVVAGDGQRVDRDLNLAGERERLTACRENRDLRATLQDPFQDGRCGVDDVFAVVHHE